MSPGRGHIIVKIYFWFFLSVNHTDVYFWERYLLTHPNLIPWIDIDMIQLLMIDLRLACWLDCLRGRLRCSLGSLNMRLEGTFSSLPDLRVSISLAFYKKEGN
jgi:hypothetical protein